LPCKNDRRTKAFRGGAAPACNPNRPNCDAADRQTQSRRNIFLRRNGRFHREQRRLLEAEHDGVAGFDPQLAGQGRVEHDGIGRHSAKGRRRLRQRPEMLVHAEDLDAVGARGIVRRGGGAGQLEDRGGQAVGNAEVIGQRGAEKAVSGSEGETGAANPGQSQVAQADADAIPEGKRADENGAGHRDAQERAEVAAGMETQIGQEQVQRPKCRP
jgi:hypothetical protein